jgi:hypothetical protein
MQSAVIESNELTSQSNVYFSDVPPIIFSTHPMFVWCLWIMFSIEPITHRSKSAGAGAQPANWRPASFTFAAVA